MYQKMHFSSLYIEDGALIYNVDYKSIRSLVPQIEKLYDIKLKDRGEAHITVITPPEAQGWFTDHRGINYYISAMEIHQKYSSVIQDASFKIECLGSLKERANQVFYLVVSSPELIAIRKEILDELKRRAMFTGTKTNFNYKNYFPHITIGYIDSNIHSKPKNINTCSNIQNIKFLD